MKDHSWVNDDILGTVGWHRCSECGLRRHFQDNVLIQRVDDDCENRQKESVKKLAKQIDNLLWRADADTDTVRGLLAIAISKSVLVPIDGEIVYQLGLAIESGCEDAVQRKMWGDKTVDWMNETSRKFGGDGGA